MLLKVINKKNRKEKVQQATPTVIAMAAGSRGIFFCVCVCVCVVFFFFFFCGGWCFFFFL